MECVAIEVAFLIVVILNDNLTEEFNIVAMEKDEFEDRGT